MPRFVRNFFLDLSVDGKAEPVRTGPRSSGGGFSPHVTQRDKGAVVTALRLDGWACDGVLFLQVVSPEGNVLHTFKTER